MDEGLLGETSTTLPSTQPMDDLEPPALPEDLEPRALAPSLELQTSDLLVSATWIRLHAPRIQDLEVSSLQSNDGRAARRLRCHAEGSDCAREVSVGLYIVLYIALLHRVLLHIVILYCILHCFILYSVRGGARGRGTTLGTII